MLIKSLNGTPDNNSPNGVMKHDGKIIASNRKKADLFAAYYAKVSKHTIIADERTTNRKLEKVLRSPSLQDKACVSFMMKELKSAIAKMKTKGGHGPDPDELPPTFLQSPRTKGPTNLAGNL